MDTLPPTQSTSNQQLSRDQGIPPLVIPPFYDLPGRTQSITYEGNKVKDTVVALIVAGGLTGVVVTLAFGTWGVKQPPTSVSVTAASLAVVPESKYPIGVRPFENINPEAKAVAVYDVYQDSFLYVRGADVVRPLASLTKLMTGLVAYEHANPNHAVHISEYAIKNEGDSGLFANETWNLDDLVSFMLVSSSNDGANAIAASVGGVLNANQNTTDAVKIDQFVERMNQRAQELRLKDTKFSNPSGLDGVDNTYGGLGTAEDIAHLVAHIWKHAPHELTDTIRLEQTYTSENGFIHNATNTNAYIQTIPGIMGSKTGYTDLAGGNLAIVYDAGMNHPIVVVVLGSSREGRFSDVELLVDATNEYITSGWYEYEVAGSTPTI